MEFFKSSEMAEIARKANGTMTEKRMEVAEMIMRSIIEEAKRGFFTATVEVFADDTVCEFIRGFGYSVSTYGSRNISYVVVNWYA